MSRAPLATGLDRAIAAVSPKWAANRLRARFTFNAISGWDAAKSERPGMRNFSPLSQTADGDTLPGLDVQRSRSRELIRNAPIATGAVHTVVTNVVGTGLRMSAQADRVVLSARAGMNAEAVAQFEGQAEQEWRLFSRRDHCDTSARLTFAGMQELAFRSVLADGDVFCAVVAAGQGAPFDFALQLIDADRISNPGRAPDRERLAGGIETAPSGRPLAYHVADVSRIMQFPTAWRRLPATAPDGTPRVIHLMHAGRIDQSRGVPYLAPVMSALKTLDRYTEAELTAAVLNACIAIMGESATGASPLQIEAVAAGTGAAGGTGLQRADINFEPGMVLEGFMPGETLKSFSPERPNAGFDPFTQAVLRQVGVALELPFELLIKHFTASYSAARAALLQAWGFFRMRRQWLADGFCQPVYELVIRNAVLKGRIAAPGFLTDPLLRAAYCGARWTGPSPGQIDPLKEVNAAEKRLGLMLSTRTRETAELTGDDWESVAAELKTEADLIAELALPAVMMPPDPVAAPVEAPSAEDMADAA